MKTNRQCNNGKRSPQKKDVPLNIRITAAEKEAFDRAAEIAGVPLSSWIRERLRLASMHDLDNVGEPVPFLMASIKGRHNGSHQED